MKHTILLPLLILALCVDCFCQTPALNKPVKLKVSPRKQPIVFCDFPGDTLSYDRLINCKTLIVKNNVSLQVVSFDFSYLIANGLMVINGKGNTLNQSMIDALGKFKTTLKKISIEHILVSDGSKTISYSSRFFYVKY